MELTIIILSTNRVEYLKKSLRSIYTQKNIQKYKESIEIIVSTSNENELDSDWVSNNNFYELKTDVILEHSNISFNRSHARNLGINRAKGKKLLFLDCDIVLNETFIEDIFEHINEDVVGIHYLYGYKIPNDDYRANDIKNLKHLSQINYLNKDFIDYREQVFEVYSDDLTRLHSPWVLAWSCILSINNTRVRKIKGFDEKFSNWGGEDADLAFRLYKLGTKFVIYRNSFGLHIPHNSPQGRIAKTNNKKYFHDKYRCPETEILYYYPTYLIDQILNEVVQSYMFNMNISESAIENINKHLKNFNKTLSVGLNLSLDISKLNFDTFFVVNLYEKESSKVVIEKRKKIMNTFGILTDFEDNYFDIVYVFDSFQFLPEKLYKLLIDELSRISKKIIETNFINDCGPYVKNSIVTKEVNRENK